MGMGPGIEMLEFVGLFGIFGVGLVEAWLTHPTPEPVRASVLQRNDANQRCPYCHGEFRTEEEVHPALSCRTCRTAHHSICWRGHGGCSVYGCKRVARAWESPESVPAAPAPLPDAEEVATQVTSG